MLERQTGLSYGWGLWLRALPQRLGPITRERANAVVGELAMRPPRPAGTILPALSTWQAWRSLLHQGWEPPLREERGLRWFAGSVSGLVHVLFVLFLILFAAVRLPPPARDAGDSSRVQVQYVGNGTPEYTGGGGEPAPPTATAAVPQPRQNPPAPAQAALASAPVAPPTITTPELASPPPVTVPEAALNVPERAVPEPSTPPARQVLQVTEVPQPTREFVLTAPQPAGEVTAPEIQPRALAVPERSIEVLQAPQLATPTPATAIASPTLARPLPEVRQREISAPLPAVPRVDVQTPSVQAPTLPSPELSVREASIPTPAAPPAQTEPSAPPAPTPTPAAPAPAVTSTSPASSTASRPPASVPSDNRAAGPARRANDGGWSTPRRGDDWGAADRNQAGDSGANAGKTAGLFNADGSVRLPGQASSQGDEPGDRGAPGGANDQWTLERIEQSGTWLKRPPSDYQPTLFDKYWAPNDSILAEWVRRGIKKLEIPIPGTSKKISCDISLLQLGGGCGISDPNLNEQPAQARPPPEIPTKRTPIPTDS
ncbi:hypothetical protein ABB29_04625 [Pseudoxanthomonas dokdonensis]|uniref:Transmembrane repetitive protein n=2 Tax=Pseudoxanthomonas dokdonensis TaxID=344882 RepID=A0A0R0CNT2_9GAMM|nr:hypothetical protein ABB29_04625 [Pseudoxanthomonas dokdonensis]